MVDRLRVQGFMVQGSEFRVLSSRVKVVGFLFRGKLRSAIKRTRHT